MAMTREDHLDKVLASVVELVETTGRLPWEQPWRASSASATSGQSGKPYQGVNAMLLNAAGSLHDGPNVWFTFKQLKADGGHLEKGTKGRPVVLFKIIERTDPKTGRVEEIPLLRTSTVFHAEQVEWGQDGAPQVLADMAVSLDEELAAGIEDHRASDIVKAFFEADGSPTLLTGSRAFYNPRTDEITVPEPGSFTALDGYYRTVFHEMAHSTGAVDRLARAGLVDLSQPDVGRQRYGREELVAELTAAALCHEAGLDSFGEGGHDAGEGTINSAAYLQGWLQSLKNDPEALMQASREAKQAVMCILQTSPEPSLEEELVAEPTKVSGISVPVVGSGAVAAVGAFERKKKELQKSFCRNDVTAAEVQTSFINDERIDAAFSSSQRVNDGPYR